MDAIKHEEWLDYCVATDLAGLPKNHPTRRAHSAGAWILDSANNVYGIMMDACVCITPPKVVQRSKGDNPAVYEIKIYEEGADQKDPETPYQSVIVQGFLEAYNTRRDLLNEVFRQKLIQQL